MTWATIDDKKYHHAFREIDRQTDRGVAIISTAILQDHLDMAIRSRLRDDLQIQNKLFCLGKPINDFGLQIDIGYLLELYPDQIRKALHIVREIRNDFAHQMDPMTFKFHRERCRRLKHPKNLHVDLNEAINRILKENLVKAGIGRLIMTMGKSSTKPKTQFVRFLQFVTLSLTLQIATAKMSDARQAQSPK